MNSNEWDLAGPWPQYAAPNEAEHQSHVESGRSFANPNGLPSLITMLAQASNLAVALAAKHQQKTFRMHKGTFLRKRAELQSPLAFELTQTQRTLVNEPCNMMPILMWSFSDSQKGTMAWRKHRHPKM